MQVPWSSDNDTYADAQRPTSTGTTAQFIEDAFSGHQMHDIHGFSRTSLSPAFTPSPWLDPTDSLSHEYHASADGIPSWIFLPQPQPQAVHSLSGRLDRDVPTYSSDYIPNMTDAILEVNTLGRVNTTHTACSIPDTALGVLDHTPLHNEVVRNDLDAARMLLAAGANPNCSARGGMTPLHYAAYQRNVDMVKLLLDYGANLDAMTDKGRSVLFFALRSQAHLGNDDMLAYACQNRVGSGSHTDDDTVRVIDALFNSPTRWIRLRRSLEKADKDGVTPLMVAAGEGFHRTATMLLERGARPEVRDHANHTALKYAARSNYRDLVRLLLLADPAVSSERDLSHILKLASKNFTARATTDPIHRNDGQGDWWDSCHRFTSALIAEEMVRLCREMGVLDGLLRLAQQRRKANVHELLLGAMQQLGLDVSHTACGS